VSANVWASIRSCSTTMTKRASVRASFLAEQRQLMANIEAHHCSIRRRLKWWGRFRLYPQALAARRSILCSLSSSNSEARGFCAITLLTLVQRTC
jgi:hypothetical protein